MADIFINRIITNGKAEV